MVSVTRHEEFEAAHRLRDYDGACTNLHGHSYKIEVTVTGCCASEPFFSILILSPSLIF